MRRTTGTIQRLVLLLLARANVSVNSFISPRPIINVPTLPDGSHQHHRRHVVALFGSSSFLKQKPGESDIDFFKRVSKAASDPASFERMALGKDDDDNNNKATGENGEELNNINNKKKKKKGVYQRAEEWDAQVKARQKRGEYTWEERVQFEGQKFGNQVNQNEILRKNLKGF